MSDAWKLRKRPATTRIKQLLQLAQNGSSDALGEMLEGCRQYLLLVANEKLGPELVPKAGASDIVQDTFASAGQHFSGFHGSTEEEWLAWLRQILLNHIGTVRRRFVLAQKRRVGREVSLGNHGSRVKGYDLIDVGGETPSRHAVRHERMGELQRALHDLPDRYRLVLQLRYRDQLPFDEVARRLNLSSSATRQLWARAIKSLRRTLSCATSV